MKTIIIRNYDTGKELVRLTTNKLKNLFSLKPILTEAQSKNDVLGLGYTCLITETGIHSFREIGGIMTNDPEVIKRYHFPDDFKKPEVVCTYADNERRETELRLAVTAYPEGYVLDAGAKAANFFGIESKLGLFSIGTRNFTLRSHTSAHVFPTVKSIITYLEKHREDMKFIRKKGYRFSVVPVCDLFAKSMADIPNKDAAHLDKLNDMLREINGFSMGLPQPLEDGNDMKSIATICEMREEAVSRMRTMGLNGEAIRSFSEGKVPIMYENGCPYNLDKDGEEAVTDALRNGVLPYAVERSVYHDMTIYAVLYVSQSQSEWDVERPDENGIFRIYGYNSSDPIFSETGDAKFTFDGGNIRKIA